MAEFLDERKMMDEEDIKVFINNLNLNLNLYCFDYLAPVPLPFSVLARVNVVDDAFRILHLPAGYGKDRPLKGLLKPVQEKRVKRRANTSSCDKLAFKLRKVGTDQSKVTHTDDAQNQPEAAAVEFKPRELEHVEEEQEEARDTIDFCDKHFQEALEHLNEFLDTNNLDRLKEVLKTSKDEDELEIGLGIHLISKLAGKAYTTRKKSFQTCPCGCQESLPGHDNMWIGSENTWYGELDILAGDPASGDSVSVTLARNDGDTDADIQEDDIDSEESEKGKSEEEEFIGWTGECQSDQAYVNDSGLYHRLNHAIAQAVVFAFTEYNRDKHKGKCVPSVLIDKTGFQYVIYSPVDDILLVSNQMSFVSEDNFNATTGFRPFVVLWIILNHRLFFAKYPDFRRHFVKSGFHEQIKDLEQFKKLMEYSKNILIEQRLYFPNDTPCTISTEALDWFLEKKGPSTS